VPKGSLEVSLYYPPAPVNMAVEVLEAPPGTTPEHAPARLTVRLLGLLSSRRIVIAVTVIGLHLVLVRIFAVNTLVVAGSRATASYPLEVTFFSSETARAVEPPLNPEPLQKTSLHLPEFRAILIEEEISIPTSSMAITIPAPNEPHPDRAQPPPAQNAADLNAGTVRVLCAAPDLARVTQDCKTRDLLAHP
jgi:hypothetical protein